MTTSEKVLQMHKEWNGKAVLFKEFGGINLEDISAPRYFEIEEQLKEFLDIPVFHDDQHGTAIVVLANLVPEDELNADNILPEPFDPRVAEAVSQAVKELI